MPYLKPLQYQCHSSFYITVHPEVDEDSTSAPPTTINNPPFIVVCGLLLSNWICNHVHNVWTINFLWLYELQCILKFYWTARDCLASKMIFIENACLECTCQIYTLCLYSKSLLLNCNWGGCSRPPIYNHTVSFLHSMSTGKHHTST